MELLARFLDDPSSDDELPVLADALTEVGDPRGELIALQLAPSTPAIERKVAKLIKTHRTQLLGALASIVDDIEFRRGFLARATLTGAPDRTIGDPLWSTVEHLEGEAVTDKLVTTMKSLRSLAFTALPIAKLAKYPWLHELAIRAFEDSTVFGKRDNFPALRALRTQLTYAHSADWDFDALMKSSILKRLERLEIDVAIGVGDMGYHGLDDGDLALMPGWLEQLAKLSLDGTLVTVQGKVATRYRFEPERATVTIPRFPKAIAGELRATVDPLIALVRTLRPTVEVTDLGDRSRS
jgi:hypothetical protein